jgi:hypothetical protein
MASSDPEFMGFSYKTLYLSLSLKNEKNASSFSCHILGQLSHTHFYPSESTNFI